MSLNLDNAQKAANAGAAFIIDTIFKGVSLTAQGLAKGASLTGESVYWAGRKVALLGPVIKQAGTAVAKGIATVGAAVATVVRQIFSTLAFIVSQGYKASSQFVTTHPKEIALVTGTVAAVLLIQKVASYIFEKPAGKKAAAASA